MNVKGSLIRARFLFVVLNHGRQTWELVLDHLTESEAVTTYDDVAALAEIDVERWYPLAMLDRLDRAIAAILGGEEGKVFDRLGEFSATNSLSGAYSSLLNPDVHAFLSQSALIHRSYQDFGEAKYEPLSEMSGLLTINYDIAPPPSYCASGAAYFRRAVGLCGGANAQVTHTRCSSRGDPACEFYLTWQ